MSVSAIKSEIVVDKKKKKIICTNFWNGRRHNFKLFKESDIHTHSAIKILTDTGYQGIQKIHPNAELPKKKAKRNP